MKFEELFFQNGNKNIDRAFSNFIDERLDECIKELKKNNGNYLKSAKANKELCAKLQDIAGDGGNRSGTGLDEVDDSEFFQNRHNRLLLFNHKVFVLQHR